MCQWRPQRSPRESGSTSIPTRPPARAFDEQGDRERGARLTLSIPFGGARRSAIYAAETAKASDLQAQAAKVRREILSLASKDVAAASSRLLA